jgi:acyl-CoA thioester hydrolase
MLKTAIDLRVRYAETDMMGFAYHGNYTAWFEMARVQMLDDIGYPYRVLEAEGFRLPVLELNIVYRKPVTFDDRLTIEAIMENPPTIKLHIRYTITCRGEITAEGFTRHAFINPAGRPARPPKRFLDVASRYFSD